MKNISASFCKRVTNVLRCWVLFFVCCVLGGCTSFLPESAGLPRNEAAIPQSPLDYYAWAKAAPKTELQAELDKLEAGVDSNSLVAAVRTSVILITSELADNTTEQQASALLTRAASLEAENDDDMAYKVFGEVLQAIVQQRLDLQSARTTNRRALTEIDALKKRNAELAQQIEQLTSIERQIIERERRSSLEP
jgi:hypothetical protein